VSPGKPTSRLLRTAFCKVVSVGENNAAWANATNSPVRCTWLTMCVLCCIGSVVGTVGEIVGISTGTDHSRVVGFLRPLRMVELKYWMSTRCLSKTAVHPTSHNWPTDSRECGCSAGNRWAMVAVLGMIGICSWVAAIDWIFWPSGRLTEMFGVSIVLVVGRWAVVRKWPVLPVSAMVWTYVGGLVVGGPKSGFGDKCLVVNRALL
jgi:hypothetical protein